MNIFDVVKDWVASWWIIDLLFKSWIMTPTLFYKLDWWQITYKKLFDCEPKYLKHFEATWKKSYLYKWSSWVVKESSFCFNEVGMAYIQFPAEEYIIPYPYAHNSYTKVADTIMNYILSKEYSNANYDSNVVYAKIDNHVIYLSPAHILRHLYWNQWYAFWDNKDFTFYNMINFFEKYNHWSSVDLSIEYLKKNPNRFEDFKNSLQLINI